MAGDDSEAIDTEDVASCFRDRADNITVHSFHDGDNGDYGGDADDDAEQGQECTELVGAKCRKNEAYRFNEVHDQALRTSLMRSSSMRPSRKRMTRRACAATSASCVTRMMVLPCWCNRSNNAR